MGVLDIDVGDLNSNFSRYNSTSLFTNRWDNVNKKWVFHCGFDLIPKKGEDYNIYAFVGGEVIYADEGKKKTGLGGYGNVVVIRDGNKALHLYCHLKSIDSKFFQKAADTATPVDGKQRIPVTKNELLGVMGTTGYSTGVHLHYEIRRDGRGPLNPDTSFGNTIYGYKTRDGIKENEDPDLFLYKINIYNPNKYLSYSIKNKDNVNPPPIILPDEELDFPIETTSEQRIFDIEYFDTPETFQGKRKNIIIFNDLPFKDAKIFKTDDYLVFEGSIIKVLISGTQPNEYIYKYYEISGTSINGEPIKTGTLPPTHDSGSVSINGLTYTYMDFLLYNKDAIAAEEELKSKGIPYFSVLRSQIQDYLNNEIYEYKNDAFSAIKNLLYTHTNFNEKVNIVSIPIYSIDVDTIVNIMDLDTKMIGDYRVQAINYDLTNGGTMSLTAEKIY